MRKIFTLFFSRSYLIALWSLQRRHHLRMWNEQGFSLVEIIVAGAISAAVVVGTSSIFIDSTKLESSQERLFWISARRIEFQTLIRSANSWNAVLANNPAMSCFAAGTSCQSASTPQPLKLPIDNLVLDGASNSVGMSNKGIFCNSFDATIGNSACPVGLKLNWVALCDDANCLHAQPKMMIGFQAKETGGVLQDFKSYDLVVFKDPTLDSLNGVCTAMSGKLVGTNCSIPSLSKSCDPANTSGAGATYPLGFDSTGTVICGKPNPGSCAPSDVATGFDANGGILCSPACL